MGYRHVYLEGVSLQEVRDVLGEREARLSGTTGQVIVVLEPPTLESYYAQQDEIAPLAAELSGKLNTLAFAVLNLEEELLLFWAYDRGEQIFAYDSNPMYLGCPVCSYVSETVGPEAGDIEKLAQLFGHPEKARALKSWVGRKRGMGFLRESQRHAEIARLLGLPGPSLEPAF
ncbi:hypothetical protein [Calidithermus roseus]|uniref:Uncharacterized protein n=1 Tax=Calidithermus roseus TaxID=1644118 RepID=A0A399ET24_9DEIN|nr:hypothetical protein [Calidithermus roseus]RIH86209.1 hypothetical protein Mrose_01867 [Calidithermus roseus]